MLPALARFVETAATMNADAAAELELVKQDSSFQHGSEWLGICSEAFRLAGADQWPWSFVFTNAALISSNVQDSMNSLNASSDIWAMRNC